MSEEGEDVKPKIELTINYDAQGQTCTVKVKPTTPLKKVFDAAEKRFGRDPGTLRFIYEGVRLQPQDRPETHEMESGDIIEAHLEQLGGWH